MRICGIIRIHVNYMADNQCLIEVGQKRKDSPGIQLFVRILEQCPTSAFELLFLTAQSAKHQLVEYISYCYQFGVWMDCLIEQTEISTAVQILMVLKGNDSGCAQN